LASPNKSARIRSQGNSAVLNEDTYIIVRILKSLVVIVSSALFSCTTTHDSVVTPAPGSSTSTNSGGVSLSQWYVDSLPLCTMRGSQLEEFQTSDQGDLWQRIRAGFHFPPAHNHPRVQEQVRWYSKHPRYMAQISKNGSKYLYHIVEELEKRNMPMELALIPVVESAYNPFARAPGDITGMWQMIPGTARRLGLKQTFWYDGRKDVVAQTDAALDYLQKLNGMFGGDWLLTVAAYNRGEGAIAKAVKNSKRQGKSGDYWDLAFTKEIGTYVPKLLAIKAMIEEPERYGMTLYPIPNRPYFAAIDVGAPINLSQATQFANVSLAELQGLNPGITRGATDPSGPHTIYVPQDKAALFIEKMATIPLEKVVATAYPAAATATTGSRYRVQPGDSLSVIAKRHNTTVKALQALNNLKGTNIVAGETLIVAAESAPVAVSSVSAPSPKTNSPVATAKGQSVQHKVASGESLWTIGKRYKVSVRQLIQWNRLPSSGRIRPGQILVIGQ
jgi:membrane-bound lytic murein transglycosylase D